MRPAKSLTSSLTLMKAEWPPRVTEGSANMAYANRTNESSWGSSTSSSASCRGSWGSADLPQAGRIGSLLNPTHLQCQLLFNRAPTDSFSVYQTMEKWWFPQTENGRRIQKDSQSMYVSHCRQQLTGTEKEPLLLQPLITGCRFLSPALQEGLLPAITGSQNSSKNNGF